MKKGTNKRRLRYHRYLVVGVSDDKKNFTPGTKLYEHLVEVPEMFFNSTNFTISKLSFVA